MSDKECGQITDKGFLDYLRGKIPGSPKKRARLLIFMGATHKVGSTLLGRF